jgi:hypothetical protein
METRLKENNPVLVDSIDQPMLLRNAAAPATGQLKSEGLRFADSFEGAAQDGIHKLQCPQRGPAISLDPIHQVFAKFGIKDGNTLN